MNLWEPKRKCPKAVPTHLQTHVVWSRALKCSVKSYLTGPSTKCYIKWIYICAGPHTWQNRINQRLWAFGTSWSPSVVLGLPPRGGFWKKKKPKRPWNMIHSMPCRNPCRLYIHLAFAYSLGPSSVVWTELGPAPPFPPMKMLEVYWSRALRLVHEVALIALLN